MPVFDLTSVRNDENTASAENHLNADELQNTNIGEVSKNKSNTGELIDEEKKKSIELDGPLSSIYAQALNIAFAKESAADGSFTQLVMAKDVDDEGVDPDLYIYASDEKSLNLDGVGRHFDQLRVALDRYHEKKKIVVIENSDLSRPRIAIEALEDFAISKKAKVIYRRQVAIEAIEQAIKALY
jgi:hypothetical protein